MELNQISPETLMQLGLYDYVWGDNWYPKAMQAAVEAEKNREAQRAYNDYLKEYDKNQHLSEQVKVDKVEYAKLQKERATADPRTKVVIDEQMKNIEATYKDTPYASYFNAENTSKMDKASDAAAKREAQRSMLKMKVKALLDTAKTPDEKMQIINDARELNKDYGLINAYNEAGFESPWTEEDLAELAKYAEGVETTQDALRKNSEQNLIKDVNEKREEKKKADELHKQVLAGKKLFGKNKQLHDTYYPSK